MGGASATAASAPSSRRPRKALLATGVVAAAVALCAVVASMGFATGWLGNPAPSDPVPMPSVVTDAPSDGDDASKDDETDRKDAAEEASEGADGETGAIGHRPFRVGGRCCTGSGACSRTGPGSLGSQHRHGDGIHRQLPRRVQWLPLILGRRHGHPQPGRIRLRCPLRYRSVGGRVERLRQLHRRPCGIRLRSRQRLAVFRQRIVARIRVRFVYPKRWRKHYVDIHLRFGQRPVDVRLEESGVPCSAIRKWPRSWLHWRSSSPCSW